MKLSPLIRFAKADFREFWRKFPKIASEIFELIKIKLKLRGSFVYFL